MSGWPNAHAIVNGELYRPSIKPNQYENRLHKHIMRGINMARAAEAGSEVDVNTISSMKIPM